MTVILTVTQAADIQTPAPFAMTPYARTVSTITQTPVKGIVQPTRHGTELSASVLTGTMQPLPSVLHVTRFVQPVRLEHSTPVRHAQVGHTTTPRFTFATRSVRRIARPLRRTSAKSQRQTTSLLRHLLVHTTMALVPMERPRSLGRRQVGRERIVGSTLLMITRAACRSSQLTMRLHTS